MMHDPKYLAAKQLAEDATSHEDRLSEAVSGLSDLVSAANAAAALLRDRAATARLAADGLALSADSSIQLADALLTRVANLATCSPQQIVAAARALQEMLIPPLPVFRSGMNYQFGFREPANSWDVMTAPGGKYDQIEAWLGRKVDLIPVFLGSDQFTKGWPNFVTNYVLGYSGDPKGQLAGIYARGSTALFGMPIMPTSLQRRYDLGARGDFDEPHRAVYRRIREIIGEQEILLRIGWEVNEGYPWSWIENSRTDDGTRLVDDPDWRIGAIPDNAKWRQLYIDTFRRLVDVARAELPGVVICWNHLRDTRRNVGAYFPGNAWVDRVTMDPYDNGNGGYVVDEASWNRFKGVYANDSFNGPEAMLLWADAHDLDIGFDEWGCVNKTPIDPTKEAKGANLSPASPTNNGFYVRKMEELFQKALAMRRLKHQSYFQTGSTGIHQLWPETPWNEQVRLAYLYLYRALPAA